MYALETNTAQVLELLILYGYRTEILYKGKQSLHAAPLRPDPRPVSSAGRLRVPQFIQVRISVASPDLRRVSKPWRDAAIICSGVSVPVDRGTF